MNRVEHIGDATLYLGDAREIVPTLLAQSIDFIFTDPPYGHNNNNGDLIHRWEAAVGIGPVGAARPIASDGTEANELVRWFFAEAARLLPAGCCCCCCCCGGGGPDPQFARWSLWLDEALGFKQMVVWDKGPVGMGWHYRRSYETVLVGEKPGAACSWYANGDTIENIIRPGYRGIRKIIPTEGQHPTLKPAALAAHFIRLHSESGQLVLDPFMGSGTTCEAALGLGRRFVGIEINPHWFNVACRAAERSTKQSEFLGLRPAKPLQTELTDFDPMLDCYLS